MDRPFQVVARSGSDGKPVVEVENGGKKQQFVCLTVIPLIIYLTLVQSPEELSAMVLVKMRETAAQYLNKPVK